jgi:ABC-2 type transport system permease protein
VTTTVATPGATVASRAPVTAPRLRTSTLSAFGALLLRDLTVLRKNLKEFIPRTILQPLLLVFVFTYVFPKIGQGIGGGGAAASTFSSVLVAGVVATAILFQGSRPSRCRSCRSSATRARSRTACSRRCRCRWSRSRRS